jgi:hypothetical protein
MAGLYGKKAVIFDNMAYELAMERIYWNASNPIFPGSTDPLTGQPFVNEAHAGVISTFYAPSGPSTPTTYGVSGYRLEGQALNFQSEGYTVGQGIDWGLSSGGLHSIAMLVLNIYAEQRQLLTSDAKAMTQYIGSELMTQNTTTGLPAANIAYSVVDEGIMPKGKVAVRDLFDDMDDVGKLIAVGKNMSVGANDEENKSNLAQIIVEFADMHANEKKESETSETQFGVFHKGDQGLFLSLDEAAWGDTVSTGWTDMKADAIAQITAGGSPLPAAARAILDEVDYAYFHNGGTIDLTLNDSNPLVEAEQLTNFETAGGIVFGSIEDDRITGGKGDDFIRGGDGGDILKGALGDDVLLGGRGGDTLIGGDGKDILLGGEGADVLVGGGGVDQLFGGAGDDILIAGDPKNKTADAQNGASEIVEGGRGADYIVLTVDSKSPTNPYGEPDVVLKGGDKTDKLFLTHDLLFPSDVSASTGKNVTLHALTGGGFGVYVVGPPGTPADPDANVSTGTNGQLYKTYYYDPLGVQTSDFGFVSYGFVEGTIEYRHYFEANRLEIIVDPRSITSAGQFFITIEDFRERDYGINFLNEPIVIAYDWTGSEGQYDVVLFIQPNPDGIATLNELWEEKIAYELQTETAGVTQRAFASAVGASAESYRFLITGDEASQTISGNDSAETIYGNGGNDVIKSEGGDDRLFGDEGNDRLIGGQGSDQLNGGGGMDTADYRTSAEAVQVSLFDQFGSGGDA